MCSHCPKSCNCGGLHRVWEKWPRRRRHTWMTLASCNPYLSRRGAASSLEFMSLKLRQSLR
jgi:hypothetical protein